MPNPDDREAGLQVRTRTVNEWIEGANDCVGPHAGTDPFRCECGDGNCQEPIELTRAEYESVRASPTQFAVARNHEHPGDVILTEHPRYTVVEKTPGAASKRALQTNPR